MEALYINVMDHMSIHLILITKYDLNKGIGIIKQLQLSFFCFLLLALKYVVEVKYSLDLPWASPHTAGSSMHLTAMNYVQFSLFN